MKYVLRVLKTIPSDFGEIVDCNVIEEIRHRINYINNTIQPFFSHRIVNNNDNMVSREKIIDLWINRRKKAIEIINNKGFWRNDVIMNISIERNENYFKQLNK